MTIEKQDVKIYFKGGNKARDVKELFELLISKHDEWHFEKTYFDLEFTKPQCHRGRRSFSDLCLIAKTYFPDIDIKDVAKILVENYSSYFCQEISKVVFHNIPHFKPYSTFYGSSDTQGTDGWSYNKIKKLTQ